MAELYEIRLRGALDDAARAGLAEAVRSFEVVESVMRASVVDDAELRGILARVEELGCELLTAQRVVPRRRGGGATPLG